MPNPATEKQIKYANNLGIKFPNDITLSYQYYLYLFSTKKLPQKMKVHVE